LPYLGNYWCSPDDQGKINSIGAAGVVAAVGLRRKGLCPNKWGVKVMTSKYLIETHVKTNKKTKRNGLMTPPMGRLDGTWSNLEIRSVSGV
jgi:hypothetical protein